MKNKIFLNILFLSALGFAQINQSDFAQAQFITKDNLIKTVKYLSSRELAGRLGGSPGYNKAANFMANEFSHLGLKPLGNEGYFQKLYVEYNEILPPAKLNLIGNEKVIKEYKLGKDYVFRGFTGSGHFKLPVAFVGYGLSKPEFGYDDYAGIDVKDKIVIAFKYNPKWKIREDKDWGESSIRYKIENAAVHGAKAIMFVSFPNDKKPQKPILSILEGEGKQNENFPSLHIDIPVADDFISPSGYALKDLQTRIDSLKKPFSISLNTSAEILATAKYTKEKETMNVIGLLEGSDEKLKNEYLIIGAHLDHVGSQANYIYAPGANDNASGSAAVLEIARAFTKNNIRPKRSIIFTLFASEEIGLAGAKHMAENLPVEKEKVIAMINLDCVASGDSIQVGNGKSAPLLWQTAWKLDSVNTKQMTRNTWSGGGADATPFHQIGIPCAYFVTTNGYENLHCTTDTPETLNKDLFEKIVRLALLTSAEIANGNYPGEKVIK